MESLALLLVEDSHWDVALVKEALKQTALPVSLTVVAGGEAALAYLRKEGPYTQSPTPDLLLLDLHMPRRDGRAVLAALRSDPALHLLPVVIFTSSAQEHDIRDSYGLCANLYIQKPLDLTAYLERIRALVDFWAKHVSSLPR